MILDLFPNGLKANLTIDSHQTLQYRHLIKGTFNGTKIFGKFFHYDDSLDHGLTSLDEKSDRDWAYDSLKNSTYFHSVLQDIEKKLNLDLGIAKLIDFEISEKSIYQISELIDGKALKYDSLSNNDLIDTISLLSNWRNPLISELLKNQKHSRWYFDSYSKARKCLKSSFLEGNFSNGINNYKDEPLKDFLDKKGLNLIIKAFTHFIDSKELETIINNFQGIKTVQHSDIIAGWIERNDRSKNYEGNLMKDKNSQLYIIDFDFGTISENIFISLFADVIKLDFYLFDQTDKSNTLKQEAFKIFSKHNYDFDLELSWNVYTFLHGVLWELPFWVQVYNSTDDKNKIANNCFNWLVEKVSKSSEALLEF